MAISKGLYRVTSWLKHQLTAWHTGGEGVHSPYLFEWVRMVMSDKNSFYVWKEIEQCRERMLRDVREIHFVDYGSGAKVYGEISVRRVCDIAAECVTRKCYAQMLGRLVYWLGHSIRGNGKGLNIVELGTSLGITTAYLASMDKRDKVITFEGCEAVIKVAKENWKELGLNNIQDEFGAIDATELDRKVGQFDVAFIDANHSYSDTCEYFNVLVSKVHSKSVIVVDDIHHSKDMERAWQEICSDERVTSTMDLYQMGLIFFDKNYLHKHYKMRL